jgi:hypothetical protein
MQSEEEENVVVVKKTTFREEGSHQMKKSDFVSYTQTIKIQIKKNATYPYSR